LINIDALDEIGRYFINNIYNYPDGIVAISDNEAPPGTRLAEAGGFIRKWGPIDSIISKFTKMRKTGLHYR
jgi:hypothetical protein